MRVRATLLAALTAFSLPLGAAPIVGIDHVPLAVRDLDRAEGAFRDLGFAITRGRRLDNGIRNAHVEFPDGSGIELVTASSAVDAMTTQVVQRLGEGEGPTFLALHVADSRQLRAALAAAQLPYDVSGGVQRIPLPGLEWLFIVDDHRSSTGRPEHLEHPNGAIAISRVWVAPDDSAPLRRVLLALGARIERRKVAVPDPVDADVAQLELTLLPLVDALVISPPTTEAAARYCP